MAGRVDLAHAAFARSAWSSACDLLSAIGDGLSPEDLERLAIAAHLVGRVELSERSWEQAHVAFARHGDDAAAARCASWLAIALMLRGDEAQASGWFSRVARLVADRGEPCSAQGYLLLPTFLQLIDRGDGAGAAETSSAMHRLALELVDVDLLALATLCRGEALLAAGDTSAGLALLDEAMVAITVDRVSPILTGIVYCAVIEACVLAFDRRRAAQWTAALDRWCEAQPDLVPYRGQCLVHRSQVLQANGDWDEATKVALRAAEQLAALSHPAVGAAWYQLGELQRLRGEFADAERSFVSARRHGRDPYPGLALLRMAEGKHDLASATIRRMADEGLGHLDHPATLAAAVEILLAAGDLTGARSAADKLGRAADATDAALVQAMAGFATGAVLSADGDFAGALAPLRLARDRWLTLAMPYDASRAGVLISEACRALGDRDAAEMELDLARITFTRLGARPDLARLLTVVEPDPPLGHLPLTERECEVLRLVASGKSNREIAAVLVISEHTVARHLQNIFGKLGLTSRTAAAAYAFEHHLV